MKKILLTLSILILAFGCKGDPKTNPLIMHDSGEMAPNNEFGEVPAVFQALETKPEYNNFLKLVNMANMFEEIMALDNVTIFAPVQADVNSILNNELDGLSSAERQEKLRNIVNYHIVEGIIRGPVLKANVFPAVQEVYRLKTNQGAYISMVKEEGEIVITDELMNKAIVIKLDIEANNGVIHNIKSILKPQDDNSVKAE
ncbi:MAG: fasciclin domain-containing protein [Bacteroidota bacterium]